MKLFLRPLFFLSCLAPAAIALSPVLSATPVWADTLAPSLSTPIVMADVMRIVSSALALLLFCLVLGMALLYARAPDRTRRLRSTSPRQADFHAMPCAHPYRPPS
ncbi:MAG: hypothetical protein E5V75_35335 [Mesorhizobium sp.]|nr:MAG: hypothetical protein E5V75_35335 [Mesorhizobium sp.]